MAAPADASPACKTGALDSGGHSCARQERPQLQLLPERWSCQPPTPPQQEWGGLLLPFPEGALGEGGRGCSLSLPPPGLLALSSGEALPPQPLTPFLCGSRARPAQAVLLQGPLGRNLPE